MNTESLTCARVEHGPLKSTWEGTVRQGELVQFGIHAADGLGANQICYVHQGELVQFGTHAAGA